MSWVVERHCWVYHLEGHTFAFPPAVATARSGRNRTGCCWLAVIVRYELVYPLHNTFSPPSHFLKRKMWKKKLTSRSRWSLHTHIHSPLLLRPRLVSVLCLLTGGPFFVSTHVDRPTTGVGTLGGFDEERLTEVCWSCLQVGRGTSMRLGRVCGLHVHWGLVEVYVSGNKEGRQGMYLLFGL